MGSAQEVSASAPRPLDLRDLPSQTDAAYWIIVLVILGTALAGAIGPSPILMWPISVTLLVLPLRAVLAEPQRARRDVDRKATDAMREDGTLAALQQIVDELAQEIGFAGRIRVYVADRPMAARAVGSWRHHYLLLGPSLARQLLTDWEHPTHRRPAQTLLRHELAHFLHRDVSRISYARALLRATFITVGWWAALLTAWLLLAWQAAPLLLQLETVQFDQFGPTVDAVLQQMFTIPPAQRAELVEKAQTISIDLIMNFLFIAFTPLIGVGAVLWLFYWRRMLRLQEYYADHVALHGPVDRGDLIRAWGRYSGWLRSPAASEPAKWRLQRVMARLPISFRPPANGPYGMARLRRWFALHPTFKERSRFVHAPETLLQDWRGPALATAVLAVALEVLLTTPLASYHLDGFPIHFSTTALFVLITTWWAPLLATGLPYRRALRNFVLIVYAARFGWLLLNVALFAGLAVAAPAFFELVVRSLIGAGSRYAGVDPISLPFSTPADMIGWIPAYVGLQLLGPAVLLLALYLYGRANASRSARESLVRQRHWQIVWAIAVTVGALVTTPGTLLLTGEIDKLAAPAYLIAYAMGVAGVVYLLSTSRRDSDAT